MKTFVLTLLCVALAPDFGSGQDADFATDMEGKVMLWRKGHSKGARGSGMFAEKMMGKMMGCLDIRPPPGDMEGRKLCMKTAIRKYSILNNVKKGIFPDLKTIRAMMRDMNECCLDLKGVDFNETDFNVDQMRQLAKMDDWTGNEEDIDVMSAGLEACITEVKGTNAIEKLFDLGYCNAQNMVEYCESKGTNFPMMALFAFMQTVEFEPKCTEVKIPQDFKDNALRCFNEAKMKMGPVPPEIIKAKSPMLRMFLLMRRFFNVLLLDTFKCVGGDLNAYERTSTANDFVGVADWFTQFPGFDRIPEKRDQIREAYLKCGNMSAKGIPNFSSLTDEQKFKKVMDEGKQSFYCFIPKMADICGINNEISKLFAPSLDSNIQSLVYNAFLDTGGEPAQKTVDYMIEKMKKWLQ